jgi:hypothetical protein
MYDEIVKSGKAVEEGRVNDKYGSNDDKQFTKACRF